MLITGKPNIMNVTKEVLLYFTARIDIIHVGVDYHLKHHFRMIRTTARFLIKLLETLNIEVVNNSIHDADRVVRSYVFINSLWKKHCLIGIVRTKMYLCHSEILMPKDTKSLGNNKAPACESRGFVRKRKKGCILTHLLFIC